MGECKFKGEEMRADSKVQGQGVEKSIDKEWFWKESLVPAQCGEVCDVEADGRGGIRHGQVDTLLSAKVYRSALMLYKEIYVWRKLVQI